MTHNPRQGSSVSASGNATAAPSSALAPGDERKGTISERLVELIQQRSPAALVYLIATTVSALTVIGAAVVSVNHWYSKSVLWQDSAVHVITSLQAGYSYSYFTAKLGPPIIARSISMGFNESIFKERGYFVETLTKNGDEVEFFSVLACDTHVQPTFRMSGVGQVTVNKSSFASITSEADYEYTRGTFGLNGGPHMREYVYGGLQASYRTFMWGITGSCAPNQDDSELNTFLDRVPDQSKGNESGALQLGWVRAHAVPNEYGVTAPNVHISDLPPDNIGVDSISVSLGQSLFPPESGGGGMTPCETVGSSKSSSPTTSGSVSASNHCGFFGPSGS